jgi:hypothetical protein
MAIWPLKPAAAAAVSSSDSKNAHTPTPKKGLVRSTLQCLFAAYEISPQTRIVRSLACTG